jgi:hypothetical protein
MSSIQKLPGLSQNDLVPNEQEFNVNRSWELQAASLQDFNGRWHRRFARIAT